MTQFEFIESNGDCRIQRHHDTCRNWSQCEQSPSNLARPGNSDRSRACCGTEAAKTTAARGGGEWLPLPAGNSYRLPNELAPSPAF